MTTFLCDKCGCAFNFANRRGCPFNDGGEHIGQVLPEAKTFKHKPEGDTFFERPGRVFDDLETAAFGKRLSPIERAVKMDRLESEQESFIPDPLHVDPVEDWQGWHGPRATFSMGKFRKGSDDEDIPADMQRYDRCDYCDEKALEAWDHHRRCPMYRDIR